MSFSTRRGQSVSGVSACQVCHRARRELIATEVEVAHKGVVVAVAAVVGSARRFAKVTAYQGKIEAVQEGAVVQ